MFPPMKVFPLFSFLFSIALIGTLGGVRRADQAAQEMNGGLP